VQHSTKFLSFSPILFGLLVDDLTLMDDQFLQRYVALQSFCWTFGRTLSLSFESGYFLAIFGEFGLQFIILHLENGLFVAACLQFSQQRLLSLALNVPHVLAFLPLCLLRLADKGNGLSEFVRQFLIGIANSCDTVLQ